MLRLQDSNSISYCSQKLLFLAKWFTDVAFEKFLLFWKYNWWYLGRCQLHFKFYCLVQNNKCNDPIYIVYMCYIFVLYWEFHSYFNCFIKIYDPFIMTNLNKNEINISRFASKTMWPFVTTTLISNVVNTTRFWKKLHQVRSQKWLENQIILSLLEQVNRIKHRANICQTGLKYFSRVSSNIVRIKAFFFFF